MVKAKFFVEFLRVFAGFLLAVRDLDEKVGVLFSELGVEGRDGSLWGSG